MADKNKYASNEALMTNSGRPRHQSSEGSNAPTDLSIEVISTLHSADTAQRLLQELQLHQVELEQQNEQLLLSQIALEEARASYLDFYDFAPVGYCTLSEAGVILQANNAASKLFGVTEGALLTRLLSAFILDEDQDRYYILLRQFATQMGPYSCELRLVKSDGTQLWVHLAATATQDTAGVPVFRVVLSDISESKIAALALRESEQFKQAILDSISTQIAVLNNEGIIIAVNEAWQQFALANSKVSGQPARHTQIGTSYLEICQDSHGKSSEGAAEARQGILDVLNRRLPGFNLDYPCHSPNQQRWFTLSVTPIVEKIPGVVITHIEITARKKAEEDLEHHRDALVREVHHRIKNNLQGVAGLLQRELGKFLELDPRLTDAISQINAIAIVHGLQAAHSDEAIRLCDSVSHICTMVSELLQQPIRFQIEGEQRFSPVQIDCNEAVSVALILNELILNAVKHSPDGGSPPVVSLESDGSIARVCIRNAVMGTPDFSIDTGKGLGTGLSLVRALLPKKGACLDYALDPPGYILATLCLTAPVIVAAIQKEKN